MRGSYKGSVCCRTYFLPNMFRGTYPVICAHPCYVATPLYLLEKEDMSVHTRHITARPHSAVMALHPFPKVRCRDGVTTCHIRMTEAALQIDAPPTAMSEGCPGTLIWRGEASLLVDMAIPVSVMWPPV